MKVSFIVSSQSQAQNWVCDTMRPSLYNNITVNGLGEKGT